MNKNPLLAGILSLIIPGLGYIYVGKITVGFIEMIMFFTTVSISFCGYFYHSVFPGIPELALINLWIFSILSGFLLHMIFIGLQKRKIKPNIEKE